jgi:hypothetical protein
MDLRPELMAPRLDGELVARLAALAREIDGARPGEYEEALVAFERLSGIAVPFRDFQGVYGAEDHACFVRRLLWSRRIRPAAGVTRAELVEVLRRADPRVGVNDENEAYMMIFDANVPLSKGSLLLYFPPEDSGLEDRDWDPTLEEVVDLALRGEREGE